MKQTKRSSGEKVGLEAWHVFNNVGSMDESSAAVSPVELGVRPKKARPAPLDATQLAEIEFMKAKVNATHLETQLSCLQPYDFPFIKELLQSDPVDSMPPCDMQKRDYHRKETEVVSRAYEEKFLREAINNERVCALGDDCEGYKIMPSSAAQEGFALREFLHPSQMEAYEKTGSWPKEPCLCLMCKRAEIAKAFYNIKADGMCVKSDVTLQDYRNIVGVKGEYRLTDCILSASHCYEGLLDPVVLHDRTAYRPRLIGGVNHYIQWKMGLPLGNVDFQ